MNKDMMNIDDFVRDTLNRHSEPENPAAWLKMKALLDEEMPERAVPFYFRLGKPIAFLGAALLIGALCVGGYQLQVSALREKGATNTTSTIASSQNNTTPTNTTATNTTSTNTNNNDQQSINNSSNDNNIAGTLTTNKPNDKPHTSKNNPAHAAANGSATQQSGLNTHTETVKTNPTPNAKTEILAKADNIVAQTTADKKTERIVSTSNTNEANKNTIAQPSRDKQVKNTSSQGEKTQEPVLAGSVATNKDAAITPKASDGGLVKDKSTTLKELRKDSINATTIVTREKVSKDFPKRIIRTQDTLPTVKVELPQQLVKEEPKPINTNIVSTVHPSKKLIREATAASKKANKLASQKEAQRQKNIFASTVNSNQKTANTSKQKGLLARLVESLNLPQAVTDAKRDARNAQFFAGFGLGGNYTMSSNANNFAGLQFGPSAELVFNKHWSLFASLKYFNRSGGTKTVFDNYAKETSDNKVDSTKGATQYFTVKTDSTSRFFNFSTVHSFELPLTLRYAFRKFYVMTGINIAYYMPVNVEQIEKSFNQINARAEATNTTKPILNETKPMLSTADFGSRFGLGYVLGVGYQIAPAWQTDLRIVRAVWDNANGSGAQKLSSDFYRLPSVQMSVGYQFNRGRKKPTFGPSSAP